VRVLGSDIGKELGCGGHLVELRRLRSGMFKVEDAVSMEDIKSGNIKLIDMKEALSHVKEVNVTKRVAAQIRMGKQVRKSDLSSVSIPHFKAGDKLKICENRELVSVAEALAGTCDLDKLDDREVVLKLLRVFS
jgi:tRNA pseudouridine55 synthase